MPRWAAARVDRIPPTTTELPINVTFLLRTGDQHTLRLVTPTLQADLCEELSAALVAHLHAALPADRLVKLLPLREGGRHPAAMAALLRRELLLCFRRLRLRRLLRHLSISFFSQ